MILKHADERKRDIEILNSLLTHPQATPAIRSEIKLQIRKIQVGAAGEKDAAHYLGIQYGDRENVVVIHDLRIDVDGTVAQIDHLLINRLLDMWLCESKSVSNGLKINEFGEFLTFHERRPVGLPSPIEQNARHVKVMERLINSGALNLPKRLGFTMKPSIRTLVLIARGAIQRPKAKIKGLDTIIKADQVATTIERIGDNANPLEIAKIISRETLYDLAQQLVDLHRPIAFDWAARFGLSDLPITPQAAPKPAARPALPVVVNPGPVEPSPEQVAADVAAGCQGCGGKVSDAERQYCANRPKRFNGQQLCIKCQRSARKPEAATPLT